MKLEDLITSRNILAAIFDLDGLIIDSEPLWQKAEIETFRALGVPMTKEMCLQVMGLRIDEVVEHWFARYPWKVTSKDEVAGIIRDKVIELVRAEGKPLPGAVEAIKAIKQMGLPLAIASSSSLKMIEAVADKLGIKEYISHIASAEFEKKGKPDPAVYLTAANKLAQPPERCLAFEDSVKGVKAAKSAGTVCVAVPYEEIKNDGGFSIADLKINSLTELL